MSVALFEGQRQEMIAAIRVIAEHLADEIGKTALDDRVLVAMAKAPRHEFVPVEVQPYAYLNRPLPFMVAVMTDLLDLKPDDVVLEIGTGLGYQTAVLAELAGWIYSVEIIDDLAQRAVHVLKTTGLHQCRNPRRERLFGLARARPIRQGDGHGRARSDRSSAD